MQLPQIPILVFRIIQFFPKFNSSCYIQSKLLYYIVMTFACRYCDSVLSARGNRSRHETKFHSDEMKLPTYHCCLREFTSRKMSEMEQQVRTQHSRFTNCCRVVTSDSTVRTSMPNMQVQFIQFQSLVLSLNLLKPPISQLLMALYNPTQ